MRWGVSVTSALLQKMKKKNNQVKSLCASLTNLSVDESAESLAELFEKVLKKDIQAEERFYEICRATVYRICKKWNSARNSADDISQIVALEMMEKLAEGALPTDVRHFQALLTQMVNFRVRDDYRDNLGAEYDGESCRYPTCSLNNELKNKSGDKNRYSALDDVDWKEYRQFLWEQHDESESRRQIAEREEWNRRRKAVELVLKRKAENVRNAIYHSLWSDEPIKEIAAKYKMSANHLSRARGVAKKQILETFEKLRK